MAKRRSRKLGFYLIVLLVTLGSGVALWHLHDGFSGRNWREFNEAGARAEARGNLEYAEGMYIQALQYAQQMDDPAKVQTGYLQLHRLYQKQGKPALAAEMLTRAREAGSPTGNRR